MSLPITRSTFRTVRTRISNARTYSPGTGVPPTLGAGPASGIGATTGAAGSSAAGVAGGAAKKAPSKHLVWYREIVPAMMPVIGIGTAIFFALQLVQTHLSHSRSLYDATNRITHLEAELAHLQSVQRKQAASWGDSLGKVIKHVQKAAVGPSENAAGAGAAAGTVVGAGPGAGAETGPKAAMVTASTSTSTNALADRVKEEFGVGEESGKKSKWRSWLGL